jgi:hypothetical protein
MRTRMAMRWNAEHVGAARLAVKWAKHTMDAQVGAPVLTAAARR